jgi:hypothetical protein
VVGIAFGLTALDDRGRRIAQGLEGHQGERRVEVEAGEAPVEVVDRSPPIGAGPNRIALVERRAVLPRLEGAAAALDRDLAIEDAERRELFGGRGFTGEDQDRGDRQQRQNENRGDRDLEATVGLLGQRSGSSRR